MGVVLRSGITTMADFRKLQHITSESGETFGTRNATAFSSTDDEAELTEERDALLEGGSGEEEEDLDNNLILEQLMNGPNGPVYHTEVMKRALERAQRENEQTFKEMRKKLNNSGSKEKRIKHTNSKKSNPSKSKSDELHSDRVHDANEGKGEKENVKGGEKGVVVQKRPIDTVHSSKTTKTSVTDATKSSRGILKNSRRGLPSYKSYKSLDLENVSRKSMNYGDAKDPAQLTLDNFVFRPSYTNLQLKSWSVSSFDSCAADTRRNYVQFLSNQRRRKFRDRLENMSSGLAGFKNLAVFKTKDDSTVEITRHEDSDYEDSEPYGPCDVDSPFYSHSQHVRKKLGSSRLKKLKSFASLSTAKRSKHSRNSGKKSKEKGARIGKLSRMFSRSRSGSNFFHEMDQSGDVNGELNSVVEVSEGAISTGNNTHSQRKQKTMKDRINLTMRKSRKLRKSRKASREPGIRTKGSDLPDDMSYPSVQNRKPDYIPPDMKWDPNFDNGRGGLVNKCPRRLPPGKVWRHEAKRGKGGLVNKQPPPGSIAPGKIWSLSAFNGQGGIVNKPPDKIPKGMMWDHEAKNGKGALAQLPELLGKVQIRKKTSKKAKQNKSRTKRKTKKERSGDVLKEDASKEKQGRKYKEKAIKGKKTQRRDDVKQLHTTIEADKRKNELLAEINAENDEIIARIDDEFEQIEVTEKRPVKRRGNVDPDLDDTVVMRTVTLSQKETELKKLEENLKARENALCKKEADLKVKEEKIANLSKTIRSTKLKQNESTEQSKQLTKTEQEALNELEKEEGQLLGSDIRYRPSSVTSLLQIQKRPTKGKLLMEARKISGKPSLLETSRKQAPKEKARAKRIRKSFLTNSTRSSLFSNSSSEIMEEAGLRPGHVFRMFSRFEEMSGFTFSSDDSRKHEEEGDVEVYDASDISD